MGMDDEIARMLHDRTLQGATTMKMKRVTVTWEKTVDAVVYVPEDMTDAEVRYLARETADTIDRDGWDVHWKTYVSASTAVDVPEAECRVEQRPSIRWPRVVEGSRFKAKDVMVVDDAGEAIVNPEDATWWLAPEKSEGGEP